MMMNVILSPGLILSHYIICSIYWEWSFLLWTLNKNILCSCSFLSSYSELLFSYPFHHCRDHTWWMSMWLCQINVAWNLKAEVTLSLSNFDNLWTFELPWPLKVHRIFGSHGHLAELRTEQQLYLLKEKSILIIYSKTSWCIFLYWFSKHIVCVGIFVFRHPLLSLERESYHTPWPLPSSTDPCPPSHRICDILALLLGMEVTVRVFASRVTRKGKIGLSVTGLPNVLFACVFHQTYGYFFSLSLSMSHLPSCWPLPWLWFLRRV